MNPHALRVLEFDAVLERLAGRAACPLGRERALALRPSVDPEEARLRQQETAEAAALLAEGRVPFGGIRDLRAETRAAAVGGTLEPSALVALAGTLAGAGRLREYLLRRREAAPRLAELAEEIGQFPEFEAEVETALTDRAEIRESASPRLAAVRKELRATHQRLQARLQSILKQAASRDLLQDDVVTMRGDRYCLPIKAEHRSAFPGLIHDQSASGQTVFMEPQGVVELGNEHRRLQIEERQEIERILRHLSGLAGAQAEAILGTFDRLGELDFIVARGQLAQHMDATEPRLLDEGELELRRARHPLLEGEVVPIDVRLGADARVLVITGPNTGGKTVSLKTTGLLALMAQSGLQLPVASGSRLPVFAGVYADIGDEQSLQQSLSTFSGHVRQIAEVLRAVDEHAVPTQPGPSLVLLDEVGAGTDPAEGAALAKAILLRLLGAGAFCIATTHYGELKEFAHATEGLENASVEFDPETLRPTYRLRIGVPGSSHAFTIARRLGLAERVVEAAQELLGTDRVALAGIIERLTASERAAEDEERRAATLRQETEVLRAEVERQRRQLEGDRRHILERARAEAETLVRQTRAAAEAAREAIREREKELRRAASQPELTRLREEIKQAEQPLTETLPPPAPAPEPEPEPAPAAPAFAAGEPEPGEAVWVTAFSQRGTLLGPPEKGQAQVQVGSMRVTVPYVDLRRLAGSAGSPARARGKLESLPHPGAEELRSRARAKVSPELHLLGKRAEEALRELDTYLDEACLAGLSPVRVVHGKGTGALRRAVWEFLEQHPHVAAYRGAEDDDGGAGVTLVELRE